MASKFQNRMAGTIILVALGVIILPGLLDGKKKHYHEEFAAIPLVPQPGDQLDNELVPPVTQPLPSQTIRQEAAHKIPNEPVTQSHSQGKVAEVTQSETVEQRQMEQEQLASQAAQRLRQQAQQQQAQQQQAQKQQAQREQQLAAQKLAEARQREKSVQPTDQSEASTPEGRAYVIQLGGFRNAKNVTDLVTKLRNEGFKAYSVPATPVQGQINRVFVGPDSSKSHLDSQVKILLEKTKLKGNVIPYKVG